MNKLFFIIVLLLGISLQSCLFHEEDIFEKPAHERLEEAVQELYDVLVTAEDGWKLAYYPDSKKYGAYNILMKFDKQQVIMQGDEFFADITQEKDTSLYTINKSEGIVLDFNTYNKVIGLLADPDLFGGENLGGDNEFVWVRTSENKDTIFLKSKKTYAQVQLTKFSGDWDNYFSNINSVMNAFTSGTLNRYFKILNFEGGNSGLILGGYNYLTRRFEQIYIAGESLVYEENGLVFTENGIEFYKPVTVDGKTIQHLVYDKSTDLFTIGDEGVNGTLTSGLPSFVIPGDLDKVLFNTPYVYPITHLSKELMNQYDTIAQKTPTGDFVFNSMQIEPTNDVYLGDKIVYLVVTYVKKEAETDADILIYGKKFLVKRNVGGRSDTFRFIEASAATGSTEIGNSTWDKLVAAGAVYVDELRDEVTKFQDLIFQETNGFVAIPDAYFENIKFGSVDSNAFFGVGQW